MNGRVSNLGYCWNIKQAAIQQTSLGQNGLRGTGHMDGFAALGAACSSGCISFQFLTTTSGTDSIHRAFPEGSFIMIELCVHLQSFAERHTVL